MRVCANSILGGVREKMQFFFERDFPGKSRWPRVEASERNDDRSTIDVALVLRSLGGY